MAGECAAEDAWILSYAALFRYYADTDLPDDDPWAQKVDEVLCDAMNALEALAREELAFRPDIHEAGKAYRREWEAKIGDLPDF